MTDSDEIKHRKKHKHDRRGEPDFTYWTDDQKRRYNEAKKEIERE